MGHARTGCLTVFSLIRAAVPGALFGAGDRRFAERWEREHGDCRQPRDNERCGSSAVP